MKQKESVPDLVGKINPEQLQNLTTIAHCQVIEPFEGAKALEALQKAQGAIEKSFQSIKKFGGWLSDNPLSRKAQAKLEELAEQSKAQRGLNQLFLKLNAETQGLQRLAKKGTKEAQETLWKYAQDYTTQAFSLLVYADTEKWILKRANQVLNREIMGKRDIHELSEAERQQLIQALYPYDSPQYSRLIRGFDSAFNLTLGALAASQLPGTGLLVATVNLTKTLIKAANRMQILLALYGYHVQSPQALFRVTGKVIASLVDWESNPEHQPLDCSFLAELFDPPVEEEDNAFSNLVAEAFKKEAYIAIPGIGAISLGKIHFDDIKLDLLISHLAHNFWRLQTLKHDLAPAEIEEALSLLRHIQKSLWQAGWAKRGRPPEPSDWQKRLKALLTGVEVEPLHRLLEARAVMLFPRLIALPPAQREEALAQEVEKWKKSN